MCGVAETINCVTQRQSSWGAYAIQMPIVQFNSTLFLQVNFSILRQFNGRIRAILHESPLILTESWNRKTNLKQFHAERSQQNSHVAQKQEKGNWLVIKQKKDSIVITLSAVSNDSIRFVRNLSCTWNDYKSYGIAIRTAVPQQTPRLIFFFTTHKNIAMQSRHIKCKSPLSGL